MKTKSILLILVCAFCTLKLFSQNMNNEVASPQEVIEKVHKAAELLKSTGKEGLEFLRDRKSEFT